MRTLTYFNSCDSRTKENTCVTVGIKPRPKIDMKGSADGAAVNEFSRVLRVSDKGSWPSGRGGYWKAPKAAEKLAVLQEGEHWIRDLCDLS